MCNWVSVYGLSPRVSAPGQRLRNTSTVHVVYVVYGIFIHLQRSGSSVAGHRFVSGFGMLHSVYGYIVPPACKTVQCGDGRMDCWLHLWCSYVE